MAASAELNRRVSLFGSHRAGRLPAAASRRSPRPPAIRRPTWRILRPADCSRKPPSSWSNLTGVRPNSPGWQTGSRSKRFGSRRRLPMTHDDSGRKVLGRPPSAPLSKRASVRHAEANGQASSCGEHRCGTSRQRSRSTRRAVTAGGSIGSRRRARTGLCPGVGQQVVAISSARACRRGGQDVLDVGPWVDAVPLR